MEKIECDVLVVGGGPAGASAARAAAENGAKTVLVEKLEKPGKIACAEALGAYLLDLLPYKIPTSQIVWTCEGMRFYLDDLVITRKGGFWKSYSVDRAKFDPWLLDLAKNAGANAKTSCALIDVSSKNGLVTEAAVNSNGKRELIRPKVVIAADGVNSTVLSCLLPNEFKSRGIARVHSWEMHGIKLDEPNLEHFFISEFSGESYGYIFPKSKNVANVGLGAFEEEHKMDKLLSSFLEFDSVSEIIRGAKRVVERNGSAPVLSSAPIVYGNTLFVGDAACQNLKPFLEGILPGMICGEEAGKLASEHVLHGTRLSQYPKNLEKRIGEYFKSSNEVNNASRVISKLKGRKRFLLQFGLFCAAFAPNELGTWQKLDDMTILTKIRAIVD